MNKSNPTYTVVSPIKIGGKRRKVGAAINLSDEEAKRLVELGCIEPGGAPSPDPEAEAETKDETGAEAEAKENTAAEDQNTEAAEADTTPKATPTAKPATKAKVKAKAKTAKPPTPGKK